MSSAEKPPDPTGYDRLIREVKERTFQARRQLRRELPDPTPGTKQDVVAATADYFDVLEDYADDRALEKPFDERIEINPNVLLGKTTEGERRVESQNPNASKTATVPLAATINPARLMNLAKELDAIAKELGFAASTRDVTPNEEASMDDVRGLLKARGQTRALKNLPDGDATDIETPYSNDDADDAGGDGE